MVRSPRRHGPGVRPPHYILIQQYFTTIILIMSSQVLTQAEVDYPGSSAAKTKTAVQSGPRFSESISVHSSASGREESLR